jgi:hypothetical protein
LRREASGAPFTGASPLVHKRIPRTKTAISPSNPRAFSARSSRSNMSYANCSSAPIANAAERSFLGPSRKLSHGAQSEDGERFIERALSPLVTCRLQHRSLFAYLRPLLPAHNRGDPSPHFKRQTSQVANRPVYVAIGVNLDGERDVLGLWLGPSGGEGAKQWMSMLTELKNRGIADALIVCCDGLKGLPDAIRVAWPQATVVAVGTALRFAARAAPRADPSVRV